MAESAYGNVFPVAKGGSNYNTATRLRRDKSAYSKTNTKIKRINGVLRPRGYKVAQEIGAGNYANVYSAVNKRDKVIAVKWLIWTKRPIIIAWNFFRERSKWCREWGTGALSRSTRSSSRPTISTFWWSTHPMEPLVTCCARTGQSVRSSANQCSNAFLEAIHYMHSLAISHRDIKVEKHNTRPQNVAQTDRL